MPQPRVVKCVQCLGVFKSVLDLATHEMKTGHDNSKILTEKIRKCPYCPKHFVRISNLQVHLQWVHKDLISANEDSPEETNNLEQSSEAESLSTVASGIPASLEVGRHEETADDSLNVQDADDEQEMEEIVDNSETVHQLDVAVDEQIVMREDDGGMIVYVEGNPIDSESGHQDSVFSEVNQDGEEIVEEVVEEVEEIEEEGQDTEDDSLAIDQVHEEQGANGEEPTEHIEYVTEKVEAVEYHEESIDDYEHIESEEFMDVKDHEFIKEEDEVGEKKEDVVEEMEQDEVEGKEEDEVEEKKDEFEEKKEDEGEEQDINQQTDIAGNIAIEWDDSAVQNAT